MLHYSVFGGCLASAITLPELRPTPARAADWTVRLADTPPAGAGGELLGSEDVMDGVDVRLSKSASGRYRLAYDDTGVFDISADGRDIAWWRGPRASVASARLDIINRVLPIALHAAGMFCLHGSAVACDGAGVAFVAPRGYGKSTLAVAMLELGASILTDDALALVPVPPVLASPGVHSVRLLDDAARAVIGDAAQLEAVGAYPMTRRDAHRITPEEAAVTKQIIRGLPDQKLALEPVPLAAVYFLTPTRDASGALPAARELVPAVRAAVALVEHSKSGALLGRSEAPVLFGRAVAVARSVPVYRLTLARDLARLAEVARQLAGWHRALVAQA